MSRVFGFTEGDSVEGSAEYVGTADMTVAAWVKISSGMFAIDRCEIMSTEPGHPAGWELSVLFGGFPNFGVFNGSYVEVTAPSPISEDVWTHLMGIRDDASDELRLYVNGALVATETGAVAPTSSGIELQIGQRENGSRPFVGKMAHVGIWDVGLDGSQRTALQTSKPSAVGSPTVYVFDDIDDVTNYGSDGITFTNTGTVYDADAPSLGGGGGQPFRKRWGGVPHCQHLIIGAEGIVIY